MSNVLPARFGNRPLSSILAVIFFILVTIWCFGGSGFSISQLIGSSEYLMRFLNEAFPPLHEHGLTYEQFYRYWLALVETFQMAFVGTLLGIVVGFILALFASRGLPTDTRKFQLVQWTVKMLISLFRTVPDLVWAIIFVMVVGLGAFAGTLTIMVDTIGFCDRFFAEEMEDVDRSPAEALVASGARRIDTVFAAVVPAATPGLITTSLFAFEKAIRSSVVLGLVGAGGIGLELQSLMNWMSYDRAMVIIGMIFVLVLVVEQASSYFRKMIIKDEK